MNEIITLINNLFESYWLPGVAAILLLLTAILVLYFFRRRSADGEGLAESPPFNEDSAEGMFGGLTAALAAQIPETERETTEFATLLRRAGLYRPSAQNSIYALRFVLMFVPLVITLFAATFLFPPADAWRVLIIGGLITVGCSIIPRLYVFFRQRQRTREIRHGLADMMDMLSMCLSGGLPVTASLEHVSKNLSGHLALTEEIQIMKRQAEVGSLGHALRDFADRVDITEVRQFVSLLTRGDQLGTQLSASLHEQADHFRATRKQIATIQANRAPVKLTFPLVFCFMPAALILLMGPALLEIRDFIQNNDRYLSRQGVVQEIERTDQQNELRFDGTEFNN